jgi:isobutyryl-CoA mutase
MDTMYQRGKIQEESLHYERLKHSGELPLIGVNTFLPREGEGEDVGKVELMRSTETEKDDQVAAVNAYNELHAAGRPVALERLREVARARENVFAELMEAVKVASLGEISGSLYEVGGEYRRNM